MRVVIADDDVIVLAGVQSLLETFPEVEIEATCTSLDGLMAAVDRSPPDVVLTDIRMPPGNATDGIEAARRLRGSHPDVGVVVLSQFVDPQLALAVLKDGATRRGYLLKERVADADHLFQALDSVAHGGSFIDARVLDALVAARSSANGTELSRLTAREREVLGQIAEGRTNAAIGEELYIGERAVEKHISSIFSKLDLNHEPSRHKRVAAVLAYLADDTRTGEGWPSLP